MGGETDRRMRAVVLARRSRALLPNARLLTRSQNTLALDSVSDNVDPRRQTISVLGKSPSVSPDAFVAPSATLIGQVNLADKTGVWYNSVLRGDLNPISVGYNTHIMDGTVVGVDSSLATGYDSSTVIGQFVTVGARCYLKACTIQDNATLGDGCVVLEGALIEAGAVLAAGSVVPAGARIPAGEMWGGNPLQFIRKLEKAELEVPASNAAANFKLAGEHAAEFLPDGQAYQDLK